MISRQRGVRMFIVLGFMNASILANADSTSLWKAATSLDAVAGSYTTSNARNAVYRTGLYSTVDEGDTWGVGAGYHYDEIVGRPFYPSIYQSEYFLRLHNRLNVDRLPGHFFLQCDGHYMTNNDATGATKDVSAAAPQVAYLSQNQQLYGDLGYAYSSYPHSLSVDQYTASVGSSFGFPSWWARLRGYLINPSSAAGAEGQSRTTAADATLSYWLPAKGPLGLAAIHLDGLVGQRIFAVDSDAMEVYNLADVQKASTSVGLEFHPGDHWKAFVVTGYQSYENVPVANRYGLRFLYFSIGKEF